MTEAIVSNKLIRRLINEMDTALKALNLAKEAKKAKKKPLIILGPSAVGKDTMINRLKKNFPEVINKLPSYTTRTKRKNEKEGIDYYFVTKEEFLKMKNEGKLIGIQEYNNNYYASNKDKLNEALKNKDKVVVLNYNIETVKSVKDELEFNSVAILPPCENELRKRLIKRGTKVEEIEKRMACSIKEIQLINEANYIDFRLVNDEEEKAYQKLLMHLKEKYPQFR